jgi:hypothetical protein
MGNNVRNTMKCLRAAALALAGWLAFVFGQMVTPIGLKVVLLSTARVLPEAVCPCG